VNNYTADSLGNHHSTTTGQFQAKPGSEPAEDSLGYGPNLRNSPIADLAPYPRTGVPDMIWARDPDKIMAPICDEYGEQVAEATANALARLRLEEIGVTTSLQAACPASVRLEGLEYRMKAPESLARKLRSKMRKKGLTPSQAAGQTTDGLRFTFCADNHDRIADTARQVCHKMGLQGYRVVEAENSFQPGNQYKGLHVLLRTPLGSTVEVQFHSAESLRVKGLNHIDYEHARDDDCDETDRRMLFGVMQARSEAIPEPEGMAGLADLEGCPVVPKFN